MHLSAWILSAALGASAATAAKAASEDKPLTRDALVGAKLQLCEGTAAAANTEYYLQHSYNARAAEGIHQHTYSPIIKPVERPIGILNLLRDRSNETRSHRPMPVASIRQRNWRDLG